MLFYASDEKSARGGQRSFQTPDAVQGKKPPYDRDRLFRNQRRRKGTLGQLRRVSNCGFINDTRTSRFGQRSCRRFAFQRSRERRAPKFARLEDFNRRDDPGTNSGGGNIKARVCAPRSSGSHPHVEGFSNLKFEISNPKGTMAALGRWSHRSSCPAIVDRRDWRKRLETGFHAFPQRRLVVDTILVGHPRCWPMACLWI